MTDEHYTITTDRERERGSGYIEGKERNKELKVYSRQMFRHSERRGWKVNKGVTGGKIKGKLCCDREIGKDRGLDREECSVL